MSGPQNDAPFGEASLRKGSHPFFGSAAFGFFTHRIAGKIVLPYVVLIGLVAVLATYATINLVAGSLEEKFQEELVGAGRAANEAMVLLEERHLAVLRQMTHTVGVDEALLQGDEVALQEMLAPVAANYRLDYLDVFDQQGRLVLALRSTALGENAVSRVDPIASGWPPIRRVLSGQADRLGDKQAGVVHAAWGHLFVSAAPVTRADQLIGAMSVAAPLEDVSSRLSQESGTKGVTLYDTGGVPLVSTLRASPAALAEALGLSPGQVDTVMATNRLVFRRARVGEIEYVEALGILAIRQEAALVMGIGTLVAIIEERGAQTRGVLIALFGGVVVVVLAIGIAVARTFTGPVYALVAASDRIRLNQLDFELPVKTSDEHGLLTVAFNEMTGGLRERERSRTAIEGYMSPRVYDLIQSGDLRMGGVRREITVFKSDIRNFTNTSELMEPELLVEYINRYFERMVAPIARYEGEVDKYMGDSILAKFGATVWYPDHARRAVLAMVEMAEACVDLNKELAREGLPEIYTRIGANTGVAVVGNIGSTQRFEYTIVSDAVNVAQRVEELGKEVGWDLLISEQTYAQVRDVVAVGEPWAVRLRGRTQDTLIYPVLGRINAVPKHRELAYQSMKQGELAP